MLMILGERCLATFGVTRILDHHGSARRSVVENQRNIYG